MWPYVMQYVYVFDVCTEALIKTHTYNVEYGLPHLVEP